MACWPLFTPSQVNEVSEARVCSEATRVMSQASAMMSNSPCSLVWAGKSVAAPGIGGTCPNPVTFSGNTGNFNTTGGVCYRTSATVNGWGCYNFDGRTLTVGGVARTCGQMPVTRSADGYYYFQVTAGTYPWAGLYTW